jgi:hypothetical protein
MAGATDGRRRVEVPTARELFVWIGDYVQAQKLMNRQLEMDWADLLS